MPRNGTPSLENSSKKKRDKRKSPETESERLTTFLRKRKWPLCRRGGEDYNKGKEEKK